MIDHAHESAALSKLADARRRITFDPSGRPEVANLLTMAGLFLHESPESIAERVGDGGGRRLKEVVTEAVNEGLVGHRQTGWPRCLRLGTELARDEDQNRRERCPAHCAEIIEPGAGQRNNP